MRGVAKHVDFERLPEALRSLAPTGQTFITAGREYSVFALAVFEGKVLLQVVDDLKYPAWLPAWLFDLKDSELPSDWICNVFREEPALVLGPAFVAQDRSAYNRMVELDSESVEMFWKRAKERAE
jgi:hypothetical protein